jgi:hypothetical protein
VVSSGAIRPARAPPSIDMLHKVMRPSMSSPVTAGPAYSKTWPVPPPTPILAINPRIMSLAVTPGRSPPRKFTKVGLGRFCRRHWVASTCSTSLVPIPNASAPKAPWVAVWLSPQTIVMPGWVAPVSGPMMWTIPRPGSSNEYNRIPDSRQLDSNCRSCLTAASSAP